MPGQATVTIGTKQWECSVASTTEELLTGLSQVESIPAGTGMLFILPREQIVNITTEYMLFPLSVIFISEDVYVTEMAPMLPPGGGGITTLPCRYFLEVNAGEAEGITPGDPVNIVLSGVVPSNWIEPMITITGVAMMGMMMAGMGKAMADALSPQKERPAIYGPRGELLTQTTRRARSKRNIR